MAVLVVAGCAFIPTTKATVSVADFAAAFPTIERLGAVVYMFEAGWDGEPDCGYFEDAGAHSRRSLRTSSSSSTPRVDTRAATGPR